MTKLKRKPKAKKHSTWFKIAHALIANPAMLLVCLYWFLVWMIALLGLLFIWTSHDTATRLCILALVIAVLIFCPKPSLRPFSHVITEDELSLNLSEGRIQASRKENAETTTIPKANGQPEPETLTTVE